MDLHCKRVLIFCYFINEWITLRSQEYFLNVILCLLYYFPKTLYLVFLNYNNLIIISPSSFLLFFLSSIIFIEFIFQSSFRFIPELRQKIQRFPIDCPPYTCVASSVLTFPTKTVCLLQLMKLYAPLLIILKGKVCDLHFFSPLPTR